MVRSMPRPGHDNDAAQSPPRGGDDRLLSAAATARELGIGRDTFRRFVKSGVVAGFRDPLSDRLRFHMPTVRQQIAAQSQPGDAA